MFWGDSGTYDALAATAAEEWSYGLASGSWSTTIEGQANRGFIYFVAAIYYVFGRNTLLVQFLNGIIGSLTALCILEIGLLLYNQRVAVQAMLFTAFFPQMMFWSSGIYKDPAVMLCIALHLFATLRIMQRFKWSALIVYAGSAFALLFLRFYIFYVVIAASLLGLVVGQKRSLYFGFVTQIVLVTSLIVLFLLTPMGQQVMNQQKFFNLEELQRSRADLSSAGSGYLSEADVSTPTGALKVLPYGIVFLLFSPFPWTASNLRQILALPDVLIWYLMVPALARGLIRAVRHRLRQTMPILMFTTALTLAYGMFQANAGAAYRQRTQVMMFYFLFIADGLTNRRPRENETGQEMQTIPASAP
jgi:4-amino-4-deoxy-L-arabinose transferase-like glycosyltransferase